MWLFKILGLAAVFFVCSAWGFLKAEDMKQRERKLNQLLKSFSHMQELVRMGGYELEELCKLCFEPNLIIENNGCAGLKTERLAADDVKLIDDFFEGFGLGDAKAECERIKLFITLLGQHRDNAAELYETRGRLYRSVGVMGGLIICIFFV